MSKSLDLATTALRTRLDQLDKSLTERPSTPPPPIPVIELTPERVAEISSVLLKSHPILSMFGMASIRPAEVQAFCAAAKKGATK